MAEHRDSMMEWVLGELGKTAADAVTIADLFERFDNVIKGDDEMKEAVWQSLISRGDVYVVNQKTGKPQLLSNSSLARLGLMEILADDLGSGWCNLKMFINLPQKAMAQQPQRELSTQEEVLDTIEVDAAALEVARRQHTEEESSSQTPKKRGRGRPPKVRPEGYVPPTPSKGLGSRGQSRKTPSSQSPMPRASNTRAGSVGDHAQSFTDSRSSSRYSTPQEFSPRQTRPQSQAPSRPQSISSQQAEDFVVAREPIPFDTAYSVPNSHISGGENTLVGLSTVSAPGGSASFGTKQTFFENAINAFTEAEKNVETSALAKDDHRPSTTRNSPQLANLIQMAKSIQRANSPPTAEQLNLLQLNKVSEVTSFKQQVSIETINSTQNEALPEPETAPGNSLDPPFVIHNEAQEMAIFQGSTTSTPNPGEQIEAESNDAVQEMSTPHATPKKASRGRPRGPSKKKFLNQSPNENASNDALAKEVEITPAHDYALDREEGVSGRVYIDPTGVKRPRGGRNRADSSIAIFRLNELKDAEYLEAHRYSWIPRVTEVISRAIHQAEDSTLPPPRAPNSLKRNFIPPPDKPEKPAKKRKVSKELTSAAPTEGFMEKDLSLGAGKGPQDADIPMQGASSMHDQPGPSMASTSQLLADPKNTPSVSHDQIAGTAVNTNSFALPNSQGSSFAQRLSSGFSIKSPPGSLRAQMEAVLGAQQPQMGVYRTPYAQQSPPTYRSPYATLPNTHNHHDPRHMTMPETAPVQYSHYEQQPATSLYSSYPSPTRFSERPASSVYPSPTRSGMQYMNIFQAEGDPMPPPATSAPFNGSTVPKERNAVANSLKGAKSTKRNFAAINGATDFQSTRQEPNAKRPALSEPRPYTLVDAENEHMPDRVTRVSCHYNKTVGNLLMLEDMSALEFWPLTQPRSDTPSLTIPASYLSHTPVVSAPRSKPMELLVKAKDSEGEGVLYRFQLGDSPQAAKAAHDLRHKMIQMNLVWSYKHGSNYESPEEIKLQIAKPYLCDKCGDRFKNSNGLEYHLTKAKYSTCNPNAIPKPQRKERTPRPVKAPKSPQPARAKAAPERKKVTIQDAEATAEHTAEPTVAGGAETSTSAEVDAGTELEPAPTPYIAAVPAASGSVLDEHHSDEDDIVQWWQDKTIPAVEEPSTTSAGKDKPPKKQKVYKNLAREPLVLNKIVTDLENSDNSGEKDPSPGSTDSAPDTDEGRKVTLISLVQDNHGLFPGDQSMWICYVAALLKSRPLKWESLQSKLYNRAIDELVQGNQLKRIQFSFIDPKKRDCTRTIIAKPDFDFDINSERLETMKGLIKASYPSSYIPPNFAPTEKILMMLQAVASRTVPKVMPELVAGQVDTNPDLSDRELSADPVPRHEADPEEDDVFTPEDLDEDPAVEDDLEDDESQDEEFLEGTARIRAAKASRGPRPDSFKARASVNMKQRWDKAKKLGRNTLSATGSQIHKNGEPRTRVPLSQAERERRAKQAALRQQSWNQAPAFMPNPETGAWGEAPVRVKAARPKSYKPKLPEVITFMQAENGAWSERPFGHGAFPIYARPTRRADGNPGLPVYLKKIETGHRPIIYPKGDRPYGPNPPSKRLLNQATNQPHPDNRPISKLTGKPTRTYTRRFPPGTAPKPIHVPGKGEVKISRYTGAPVRTYTRRNTPGYAFKMGRLTEEEVVQLIEPHKLKAGDKRNPALETIPPSFGLDKSKYTGPPEDTIDFPSQYEEIFFVEAQPWEMKCYESQNPEGHDDDDDDLGLPDCSWTHDPNKLELLLAEAPPTTYNTIKWWEETAFDIETVPYSAMLPQPEPKEIEKKPKVIAPPPKKRARRNARIPNLMGTNDVDKSERHLKSRVLTCLADDFKYTLLDPKIFKIQVAPPNTNAQSRRRVMGDHLLPKTEARLIVTAVVIRVLVGGLDQIIDWVLVSQYFQNLSINWLKKHWITIERKKKGVIEELTRDFQKAFPDAYRQGIVPRINYDDLVGYQWEKVIQWTLKNVMKQHEEKPIPIPDNREEYDETFTFEDEDGHEKPWRETFYNLFTPVYKRIQAAASQPLVVPVSTDKPPTKAREDHQFELAKNWVRATALTPKEHWSIEAANAKLEKLDPKIDGVPKKGLIQKAINALQNAKSLKNIRNRGAVPGRPFDVTDAFQKPLRRHIRMPQVIQAARFKRYLDAEFKNANGGPVLISYFATDGAIMVITSLVAAERIRVEAIDVPNNPFGLTGGGYETRQIPRSRIQFDVMMYATDRYVYDEDNQVLQEAFIAAPPRLEGDMAKIPLWYDITGKVNDDWWTRVLNAVCPTIALRAGVNIAQLCEVFGPTLEEFDIRCLLEWGEKFGLFVRMDANIESWGPGEFWYSYVGTVCDNWNSDRRNQIQLEVKEDGDVRGVPKGRYGDSAFSGRNGWTVAVGKTLDDVNYTPAGSPNESTSPGSSGGETDGGGDVVMEGMS